MRDECENAGKAVAVKSLNAVKALPSLTFGPGTSGGRIALNTFGVSAASASSAPDLMAGFSGATYKGGRAS